MATKTNERTSVAINIAAADQTAEFNSILITTAGTLKYDDANGNTITITQTLSIGKLEVAGTKIYKVGTTITGILLSNII